MWWRGFWVGAVVIWLSVAGGSPLARAQDAAETEPSAGEQAEPADPDAGALPEEPAPVVPADEGSTATESDQESAESGPSEPGATTGEEGDADDDDSDSDKPGRLLISTDGECNVYIDDQLKGRATPEEPLEIGVDLGEIEVRASSVQVQGATWEKTLEITESQVEAVRVKMKRAIRLFRKEERQTAVYRDPKTLLMWPKRDNGRDADLRAAYAYCRDLGTGGFDDWRLPTLEELKSLEAIWLRATYKIQGGIVLSECCTWSSDYDGSERASTFNFKFRQAFQSNAGYQIGFRALCVRDWDPDTEPAEKDSEAAED